MLTTFLMPANMLVVLSGSHFLWCLIFEDEGIHGYAHNIFPSTGNPLKTDFPPFLGLRPMLPVKKCVDKYCLIVKRYTE